ncbi:DNA-formamidopyrimidine glycosylase family protein [Frankia sp. R82]|uniref:DNA-formamidopyrimidine glycosylase family protein n=1 Tax=Frankia sp. R82 TaxID=2950553 RepID=UPI0020431897|nr:DNA-formamidopyrimidine glycosylase family protein [Frankia sp. R82]MCM3885354.1 Fpg/Nei family DNA glycosylase [Frankia sp. R82]
MPEGDTVWRAARRMDAALAGEVVLHSDFRVPALATVDLAGRRISSVAARGKHLLTRFDGELTLHTHFRMEGSWHLYDPDARWTGGPDWQIRAVLVTRQRVAVGYRLAVVELLTSDREQEVVGHLGPDVLGVDWDLEAAVARLRARGRRPIGAALLDQRNLAGLGNIWRTEACFLAGVSPWTPVDDVPDLAGLVHRAQLMISAGARGGHQVTTGSTRPGQQHWVYGRAGRPCRRCGSRILVADSADDGAHEDLDDGGGGPEHGHGEGRRTTWCPRCQPSGARYPERNPISPTGAGRELRVDVGTGKTGRSGRISSARRRSGGPGRE